MSASHDSMMTITMPHMPQTCTCATKPRHVRLTRPIARDHVNATASTLHNRHLDVVPIYPDGDDDDDPETLHSLPSYPLAAGWTFSLRVRRVVGPTMMMMIHDVMDRICEGSLSLTHLFVSSWGAVLHAV